MSNELALSDVMTLGKALAESKYFSDAKEASQAVVKVLAGQELGIGPIASMSGINIIKGKTEASANILASLVKSSKKYNYFVTEHTNDVCVIEFFENGKSIGISEFSTEDAKIAKLIGKDTYKQFPRNMLFNRAMSNGVKWYCPDVTNGQAIYTPGEIEVSEPEPEDLVIETPAGAILEGVATEPYPGLSLDTGRQKWIESIMFSADFPKDGSPVDKVAFINAEIAARELDVSPVTVPEILGNGG